MGLKQNNCEVREHDFEINFTQFNATVDFPDPITYFEDHTLNHYKALIDVRVNSFPNIATPIGTETILQVVIQPRNNQQEIAVDIPLFIVNDNIEGQVVVQVEDAESISIRFEFRLNGEIFNAGATISATINVQKDFCICCP